MPAKKNKKKIFSTTIFVSVFGSFDWFPLIFKRVHQGHTIPKKMIAYTCLPKMYFFLVPYHTVQRKYQTKQPLQVFWHSSCSFQKTCIYFPMNTKKILKFLHIFIFCLFPRNTSQMFPIKILHVESRKFLFTFSMSS